jgi:hypothetical protein
VFKASTPGPWAVVSPPRVRDSFDGAVGLRRNTRGGESLSYFGVWHCDVTSGFEAEARSEGEVVVSKVEAVKGGVKSDRVILSGGDCGLKKSCEEVCTSFYAAAFLSLEAVGTPRRLQNSFTDIRHLHDSTSETRFHILCMLSSFPVSHTTSTIFASLMPLTSR